MCIHHVLGSVFDLLSHLGSVVKRRQAKRRFQFLVRRVIALRRERTTLRRLWDKAKEASVRHTWVASMSKTSTCSTAQVKYGMRRTQTLTVTFITFSTVFFFRFLVLRLSYTDACIQVLWVGLLVCLYVNTIVPSSLSLSNLLTSVLRALWVGTFGGMVIVAVTFAISLPFILTPRRQPVMASDSDVPVLMSDDEKRAYLHS